jgi:hypothetical protein
LTDVNKGRQIKQKAIQNSNIFKLSHLTRSFFMETWPENLQANYSILSKKEIELASLLISLEQRHLFDAWEPVGSNDESKHEFFRQVEILDETYVDPGGLSSYIIRARELLKNSQSG